VILAGEKVRLPLSPTRILWSIGPEGELPSGAGAKVVSDGAVDIVEEAELVELDAVFPVALAAAWKASNLPSPGFTANTIPAAQ